MFSLFGAKPPEAPTPAQQSAFGGKANKLTAEQRSKGGKASAEAKRRKKEEAARAAATAAAAALGGTTMPLVAQPVAVQPAALAAAAPVVPVAAAPAQVPQTMKQAFNFKLTVPEGHTFHQLQSIKCDTTRLAGVLALSWPSFGFVTGKPAAGYDWIAVLVHRESGKFVLVAAKDSTITLVSELDKGTVPPSLARDLTSQFGPLVSRAASA